jgi:hypoxanthine-DNA glycosylase
MIEVHPFKIFQPINFKYLLLGSFTTKAIGVENSYDWYYGSKRNQFWQLIESTYNTKLPDTNSRKSLFEKLNIGIADIIYSCERKEGNSLDSNLINIVYNPQIEELISNPGLITIYFSSRFVENLFKKRYKSYLDIYPTLNLITLPSPSPRYALLSKAEKIQRYKELLPCEMIQG